MLNESVFIPPASSLSCSSSAFQYSSVTTETREYITCHQIHVWLYPDQKFLKYPNLYWYLNGIEKPRALSVVCTLYKRKEWSDFFNPLLFEFKTKLLDVLKFFFHSMSVCLHFCFMYLLLFFLNLSNKLHDSWKPTD